MTNKKPIKLYQFNKIIIPIILLLTAFNIYQSINLDNRLYLKAQDNDGNKIKVSYQQAFETLLTGQQSIANNQRDIMNAIIDIPDKITPIAQDIDPIDTSTSTDNTID